MPDCRNASTSQPGTAGGEPHALTVCDLVTMREINEGDVKISPRGDLLAFVVKRAIPAHNTYEFEVLVHGVSADTSSRSVHIANDEIQRLDWTPDGQSVSYLSSEGGSSQIWIADPRGGEPRVLTHHQDGVHNYRWSPDGEQIAFTSAGVPSETDIRQVSAMGIVYDGTVRLSQLKPQTMIAEPEQLWIYDLRTGTEHRLWGDTKVDVKAAWFGYYSDIFWSPDGINIAALRRPAGESSWDKYDLITISVTSGAITELLNDVFVGDLAWSPNGQQIAFVGSIDSMQRRDWDRLNVALFTIDIAKKQIFQQTSVLNWPERLWWSRTGAAVYFERRFEGHSALYKVDFASKARVVSEISRSPEYLSDCSLDRAETLAGCIIQDVSSPPEVAVADLKTGSVRSLTNLNPTFKSIRLGQISKLTLTNRYGDTSFGYLVKPVDYAEGKRFPLLVILYYFPGTFLKNFVGNYPIQAFAASGYAVVCLNVRNGSHADKLRWYGPLDTLKAVKEKLVEEGIADPARTGLMGWSYGGEIVNVTVTHSDIFQAASAGEGAGIPDPDDYFLEDEAFQKAFLDKYVGGWPDGKAAGAWREISPALNARRLHAPLLIEAAASPYGALHYYTALKKWDKPVELITYPDETHVFHQPYHLISSMKRNLDWFNFWLKDEEDTRPEKKEQYERWRDLRERWRKHQSNSRSGPGVPPD